MNIGHTTKLKPNLAKRDRKPQYLLDADAAVCASLGETASALFTGGHLLLRERQPSSGPALRLSRINRLERRRQKRARMANKPTA